MADRFDDKDDDEPLDPAVERIQQRLRRLILVSGRTPTIELPAGATMVASDVDGDRVAVTLDGADGRAIQVYELSTGRLVGRTVLIAR